MSQSVFEKFARAIALSQGEFKLFFAKCNSLQWRERAIAEIRAVCSVEIATLTLDPQETQLYRRIEAEFGGQYPEALMVLGLEKSDRLDELLVRANHARDAYVKNLPFPLILWTSDRSLHRLYRVAADLESVGTERDFPVPPEVWRETIAREAENTFASLLEEGATRLLGGTKVESDRFLQQELYIAENELKTLNEKARNLEGETGRMSVPQEVRPEEIFSDLAFLLGRESGYLSEKTRYFYEESLALREGLAASDRKGIVYYCLGDWWRVQTFVYHRKAKQAWEKAEANFAGAIVQFRAIARDDLIAKFINAWGNALEHIENWDSLAEVGEEAYRLHQKYPDSFKQARACGFLAEVALARSQWGEAEARSREALAITTDSPEFDSDREYVYQAGYKFALARAQQGKGAIKQGLETLEIALKETNPRYELELYIKILRALRDGYFQQGEYVQAYLYKRDRRDTEAQFGWRGFVGASRVQPRQEQQILAQLKRGETSSIASEIEASGRMFDIEKLVERVGRTDCKITVIHGSSGVGKSSLISGGLIPALHEVKAGTESDRILPIYLRAYQNWEIELGEAIGISGSPLIKGGWGGSHTLIKNKKSNKEQSSEILPAIASPLNKGGWEQSNHPMESGKSNPEQSSDMPSNSDSPLTKGGWGGFNPSEILQYFHQCKENKIRPVLIFDQFEEFFISYPQKSDRDRFFQFLGECLAMLLLKVIFSLRVDSLHLLLDRPGLNCINGEILGRDVRYPLGNFSPEQARDVIERLTERSQFPLESELLEKLVADLAAEIHVVRPIELQIVGEQMQREDIQSLATYEAAGGKEILIERYVTEVVDDCGEPNQQLADWVFYYLTNEKSQRPWKTAAELEEDLKGLWKSDRTQLMLVLKIMVTSGLVVEAEDELENRYQLLHDYLVDLIRDRYNRESRREMEALRKKNREAERQRVILQRWLTCGSVASVAIFAVLTGVSIFLTIEAQRNERIAKIKQFAAQSEWLRDRYVSHHDASVLLAVESYNLMAREDKEMVEVDTALRSSLKLLPQHVARIDHESGVNAMSFSPDGQYVATASWDNTAKISRTNNGAQIARIHHDGEVRAVSFSPDGQYVATASWDNTAKISRTHDGAEIARIHHDRGVNAVSFSPDGQYVATASWDNTAKISRIDNGAEIARIHHDRGVNAVSFSLDGQYVATASGDKTAKISRTHNGAEIARIHHEKYVYAVSFSPDGQYVATASWDNTAKISRTHDGAEIARIYHGNEVRAVSFSHDGAEIARIDHDNYVNDVSFFSDGQYVATASWDNTAKISRSADGAEIARIHHDKYILAVSFSSNGQYVATASGDKTAKISRTDNGAEIARIHHDDEVRAVFFSPDGQYVATASKDKTAKISRTDNGAQIARIDHESGVNTVFFSPDGQYVATASWDKTAKISRTDNGAEITRIHHDGGVRAVSFSPDGQYIATASEDKTAKISRTHDGAEIARIHHDNEVIAVSFSPNGQYVATASWDNTAKISRTDNGAEIARIDHDRRVIAVSFSPDGQYVATASWDNTAKISRTDNGAEIARIDHDRRVRAVSFSPDGQYVATASWDNTAKISRSDDGAEIARIDHDKDVRAVSFSPDGQYVATASTDKTANISHVKSSPLWQKVCARISRNLTAEEWERYIDTDLLTYDRTCRNRPIHSSVADKASQWFKQNEDKALKLLQHIAKIDDNADLYPRTPEIERDPKQTILKIAASTQLEEGIKQANQGTILEAISLYEKSQKTDPDLEISANDWHTLCRFGSLERQAKDVMFACEKVVSLTEEKDITFRESRGLARALTGDFEGAIADFQAFVNDRKGDEQKKRKQWIEDLRADKNPFTDEVLEELRNE
ncbi:MAG: hypothetical protein J7647_23555 [Cyanobacteria bacterium SBLK]|nr:hypothetical protein [Cyanobacteria bacterium SBLK]